MPASSQAPCGNPLFLEWIKESYDQAKERNTKDVTTYKRAYESMKICPLTFSHPCEASQLNGIGVKICNYLTERLETYNFGHGIPMPEKSHGKGRKRSSLDENIDSRAHSPGSKRSRKSKAYVPARHSGGYAIILALSTLQQDSSKTLTKAEIIELAQPHCTSSFSNPSDGGLYTAWKSMETLLKKDLVYERGRPLRTYSLTEEGWDTADKIKAAENKGTLDRYVERNKSCENVQSSIEIEKTRPSLRTFKHTSDAQSLSTFLEITQPAEGRDFTRVGNNIRADSASPTPLPLGEVAEPPEHFVTLLSSPEPEDLEHGHPQIPEARHAMDLVSSSNLNSKSNRHTLESSMGTPEPFLKPTTSNRTRGENSSSFSSIVLPPGSFSVRLVLDNREVRSKKDRDEISDQLTALGVPPLVRPLPLGDLFWVAKLHDPALLTCHGEEGDEVILDWIVERKRLDDLVGSIKDGRFHEQKFRLRRSHVSNVIYLVEDFKLSPDDKEKFGEAIESALAGLQVLDGYFIKRTEGINESTRYISQLTGMLKSMYESRPLHVIPANVLQPKTVTRLFDQLRHDATRANQNYTITVPSFDSLASKSDTITLRDVFLKMLMCTRGISGDKALAIQKIWPTPRAFVEAFEHCEDDAARNLMVEKRLGNAVGKAQIKRALSAKLAEYWAKA